MKKFLFNVGFVIITIMAANKLDAIEKFEEMGNDINTVISIDVDLGGIL